MPRVSRMLPLAFALVAWPWGGAWAAETGGDALHLDGAALSLLWVLPFVGILMSIALFPLFAAYQAIVRKTPSSQETSGFQPVSPCSFS